MRVVCFMALVGTVGCSASDDAARHGEPPAAGLEAFVESLEADGLVVQRGQNVAFTIDQCEALPSCFAANATSPYGLWNLPAAPGKSLPPLEGLGIPALDGTLAPVVQLRADEALVYVGRTAPPARYFSYAPYLFDRLDVRTGERAVVFASLADALNHTNLAVGAGEGPFDADAVVIVTADANLDASLRARLARHGFRAETHNTVALPAAELRLGDEGDADSLMMLQRFALFEDAEQGEAYLAEPPVTLLRVSPDEPRAAVPLTPPSRAEHGTGTTEAHLEPAVEALGTAIRARHSGLFTTQLSIASAALIQSRVNPATCIAQLTNCLGEVSDTTYSAGPLDVILGTGSLTLGGDSNDFFVAYGVNHAATGKATYSNVVLNHHAKQAGVAAFTSDEMPGSAAVYLPDHPDRDALFAVRVARSCADQRFCLELPTTFPGVPLDQNVLFIFRAYLEPGRTVSPSVDEISTERVLKFSAP